VEEEVFVEEVAMDECWLVMALIPCKFLKNSVLAS
jgi:hypothetical protein